MVPLFTPFAKVSSNADGRHKQNQEVRSLPEFSTLVPVSVVLHGLGSEPLC